MSTVSKILFDDPSFKYNVLSERHRRRPLLDSISSMTDEEIVQASINHANREAEQSSAARALKNGPIMFLAATSIAYGALAKGSLSNKTIDTVKSLCAASLVFGLSKVTKTVTDAAINSTNKNEKQTEKYPVESFLLSLAAVLGITTLVFKGMPKGIEFLKKNFAPTAKAVKEVVSKGANKLDNSYAGKLTQNISKRASEFAALHPKKADIIRNSLFFVPTAGFIANSLALSNKIENDRDKLVLSNINKLTLCRELAKGKANN